MQQCHLTDKLQTLNYRAARVNTGAVDYWTPINKLLGSSVDPLSKRRETSQNRRVIHVKVPYSHSHNPNPNPNPPYSYPYLTIKQL